MTPEKRKRIIDRHRDAWTRHGYSPNALYWSSETIQQLRFAVLADIIEQPRCSLLDVGCGFGDLLPHLQQRGIEVDYLGLDLSAELLAEGQRRLPQARFFCGDLFDLDPTQNSFDYVLLSGALNEEMNDDGAYAKAVIEHMYRSCRHGVALNLLDRRNPAMAQRWDLQSFEPQQMLEFCQQLGATCELRDDYLDNDFSLYLRKPR